MQKGGHVRIKVSLPPHVVKAADAHAAAGGEDVDTIASRLLEEHFIKHGHLKAKKGGK